MTVTPPLRHAVLLAMLALGAAGLPAQAGTLALYLSPSGHDDAAGLSAQQPLRTLARARDRIVELAGRHSYERIDVNFLPGTYQGLAVVWQDVDLDGTPVHFRPAPGSRGKVVLDGARSRFARFFTVRATRGDESTQAPSRLHFENLVIRNYCEAISLGDGLSRAILTGNVISGNVFENIGSKYDPVRRKRAGRSLPNGSCTAAIRLQRSAGNRIVGNTFANIENLPKEDTFRDRYGPTYLHAIYIAHLSSDNEISGNAFTRFTGSPIRVRDRSDNVRVLHNTFSSPLYVEDSESRRRGMRVMRAVSQWYCGYGLSSCAEDDVVHRPECPSTGLRVAGNEVRGRMEVYANLSERSRSTCPDTPGNAQRFVPANQTRLEGNSASTR